MKTEHMDRITEETFKIIIITKIIVIFIRSWLQQRRTCLDQCEIYSGDYLIMMMIVAILMMMMTMTMMILIMMMTILIIMILILICSPDVVPLSKLTFQMTLMIMIVLLDYYHSTLVMMIMIINDDDEDDDNTDPPVPTWQLTNNFDYDNDF